MVAGQLDIRETSGTVTLQAGFALAIAAIFATFPGVQRWRAARVVARQFGDRDLAAVCYHTDNPYFARILVVHPTHGLLVLTLGGAPLATWPWPDVQDARVGPVMFMRRQRTGLMVKAKSERHPFVVPGPFNVTRPWALAARLKDAIIVRSSG
jgi:hypothetical protein